jgi:hypothetical protein
MNTIQPLDATDQMAGEFPFARNWVQIKCDCTVPLYIGIPGDTKVGTPKF